ncbi:MAG: hypothetical protein DDT23_00017 [candidate division WS2 bacterium]|nr:hypothetical protein [Candidatus Lithacetigena glycinireducens]
MRLGPSLTNNFPFPKYRFARVVSDIESSVQQRAIDATLHYIITGLKRKWTISFIYPKTETNIVNLPKLRLWRALNLKLLDKDNVWYDVSIMDITEESILKGKYWQVGLILEQM